MPRDLKHKQEYDRRYRAEHPRSPEKEAEYHRRYYNKEQRRKRYLANREQILQERKDYYLTHRDDILAYKRKYQSEHPDKIANIHARRVARIGAATITKDQWLSVMRESEWCCVYCGTVLGIKTRTLDHVVPLTRGGPHLRDNLVAACRHCNDSKNNRMPHEWLQTPVCDVDVTRRLWIVTLLCMPLENVAFGCGS